MKGLLMKDFYIAKRYFKLYLLWAVVFTGVSVFVGSALFLFYPLVLASVMPVSLISMEEKSHWDAYCRTLPFSRQLVVSEKYAMVILITVFMGILTLAAQVVRIVRGDSSWGELAMVLEMIPIIGLLPAVILLPVVFKLGAERGRIAYYVVVIGVVCGSSTLVGVSNEIDAPAIGQLLGSVGLPLAVLATVALFIFSWWLSVRFYLNREV